MPPKIAKSDKYKFLNGLNIHVIETPADDQGYAETWPVGEPGEPDRPRPKDLPLDKHGVQIFKPDKFGEEDLAGEALHLDPKANLARTELLSSLTPYQIGQLKNQSADYSAWVGKMPEEDNLRNATDSLIRGYTVGQWPKEALDKMNLNDSQVKLLDDLKNHMVNGSPKGILSGVK